MGQVGARDYSPDGIHANPVARTGSQGKRTPPCGLRCNSLTDSDVLSLILSCENRDNMKRCMKAMPILPRGFSAYDHRMRDFIGTPENDCSWMGKSRSQNMNNHIIARVRYRVETPVE